MGAESKLSPPGTVVELLPGQLVKVRLDGREDITAHVAEEHRRVSVAVKTGERVSVRRASNDPNRGTIVGHARRPTPQE